MATYMDEKLRKASEFTPLLSSNASSGPRRNGTRYPYRTPQGLCKIFFAGLAFVALAFFVILAINPEALESRHPHHGYVPYGSLRVPKSWPASNGLEYKELEKIMMETPKESNIREYSKYYTAGPHVAARNLSQAIWTRNRWQDFGVHDSKVVAYDVYINYPKSHRLALLEHSDEGSAVKYEASLEEDVLKEDPTTSLPDRVPTFHGYSASGNVTAQYVWANYGTFKDFEDLKRANVSLEGKIAIVRYGLIFRGLKVKRAQELGMVGVIIYSDPGDDGGITEEKGYKIYPEGPARQPSSVQRGSVQYLSVYRIRFACTTSS